MRARFTIGILLVVCLLATAFACTPEASENPITLDFIYVDHGNTVGISGYTGLGGNIVIPQSIDSKRVTSIDRWAFSRSNNLTGVTLSDGIVTIEESAFFGCESLTSIAIPGSVTTIGETAFFGCSSLANITIPSSVVSIGEGAFACMVGYYDNLDENGHWSGGRCFVSCPNLTITCFPDSYAHQYCVENGIVYQLTDWWINTAAPSVQLVPPYSGY